MRVSPNGISIGSAVFAGFAQIKQTIRYATPLWNSWLHLALVLAMRVKTMELIFGAYPVEYAYIDRGSGRF